MWVDIQGYCHRYQINEDGKVRRVSDNGKINYLNGYLTTDGSTFRVVKLAVQPKQYRRIAVTSLMRDAFLGGKKDGYRVIHKNGSTTDDQLYNLALVTDYEAGHRCRNNRRPIVKIDKDGNELAFYPSVQAAAKETHYGQKAIIRRAKGRTKKDEFSLCDFSFRYAR